MSYIMNEQTNIQNLIPKDVTHVNQLANWEGEKVTLQLLDQRKSYFCVVSEAEASHSFTA